jgi:hypothetical protein
LDSENAPTKKRATKNAIKNSRAAPFSKAEASERGNRNRLPELINVAVEFSLANRFFGRAICGSASEGSHGGFTRHFRPYAYIFTPRNFSVTGWSFAGCGFCCPLAATPNSNAGGAGLQKEGMFIRRGHVSCVARVLQTPGLKNAQTTQIIAAFALAESSVRTRSCNLQFSPRRRRRSRASGSQKAGGFPCCRRLGLQHSQQSVARVVLRAMRWDFGGVVQHHTAREVVTMTIKWLVCKNSAITRRALFTHMGAKHR